jgi:hypothetical protein
VSSVDPPAGGGVAGAVVGVMFSSITLALITSSMVGMGPDLAMERATLAMRTTWKTARPARIPKPSWWEKVMSPRVTTVMMPSRPKVLMARGRRLFSTPLMLTRSTERPIIRKLRVPSPRPMHAPRPSSSLSKDTQATRAATPTTSTVATVRLATSGTLGSSKWANMIRLCPDPGRCSRRGRRQGAGGYGAYRYGGGRPHRSRRTRETVMSTAAAMPSTRPTSVNQGLVPSHRSTR